MVTKLQKIKKLKRKFTYNEIGEKLNISGSRVHQILNPLKQVYCRAHKEWFLPTGEIKTCLNCYIEKKYTKEYLKKNILKEAARLQKQDRTLKTIFERKAIVKYLREVNELSFLSIAKLLNRDHSTIINLYNKK